MIFTYENLAKEGHGRLGNQLWQIAWMIGQAKGDPANFYVDPNWAYRGFFSLPEEAYELGEGPTTDGGSWFYQELYHWEGFEQEVYEWFQPSDMAYDYLYRNYPEWMLDTSVPKCSIHHRRGDYLDNPRMFPQPTYGYYGMAISKIQEGDRGAQFLVFGDDYRWLKEHYTNDKFFHCVEGQEQPVDPALRGAPNDQWDLFLQTLCSDHIIANSSFSWWGAWLSSTRRAFYPSVWWGPQLNSLDSMGRRSVDTWREGIPKEWQEIQC